MRNRHSLAGLIAVLTFGACLPTAGFADDLSTGVPNTPSAGLTSPTVVLYDGSAPEVSKVTALSWGGGVGKDSTDIAYGVKGHAIQIETAGLYQGGQIIFGNPALLGDLKADKSRYLQIILAVNPSTHYIAAGPLVYPAVNYHFHIPGSFEMAQVPAGIPESIMKQYGKYIRQGQPATTTPTQPNGLSGIPAGLLPPGFKIPGMPNSSTNAPVGPSGPPPMPTDNLHIILQFSDGSQVETLRPIHQNTGGDAQWLNVSIPLSSLASATTSSDVVSLSKILIGSDRSAQLTIGEIRLVDDTTPITASAGDAQTIPSGTTTTLVGTADGGASALKYEWDFENESGFTPEAEGAVVTHRFATSGTYKVKLRVSDVDGIKPATTANVVITVTDQ